EKTNLSTLHVRGQKVNDLDSGFEELGLRLELVEGGRITVNAPAFFRLECFALFQVENVTGHIKHLAAGNVTHRNGDRVAGIDNLLSTNKTVRGLQRDSASQVVTEV